MINPQARYPGSQMTLTAVFETDSGTATDPTTVVFKTFSPNGQIETYTYGTDSNLSKVSTGQYAVLITPDVSGRWYVRWEGDGIVVNEDDFIVKDSKFNQTVFSGDYV